MNVELPVRIDKAAFLDWVQGREERYELDRGSVIMMTGGSRGHRQITANLFKALDARIDPQRWSVLPEFGIGLQSESIRFPDIVVDRAGEPAKDLTATAPVLIAEVLSPPSERVDLGDKIGRISAANKSCGLSCFRPGRDQSMGLDARTCGFSFRPRHIGRSRCGSPDRVIRRRFTPSRSLRTRQNGLTIRLRSQTERDARAAALLA